MVLFLTGANLPVHRHPISHWRFLLRFHLWEKWDLLAGCYLFTLLLCACSLLLDANLRFLYRIIPALSMDVIFCVSVTFFLQKMQTFMHCPHTNWTLAQTDFIYLLILLYAWTGFMYLELIFMIILPVLKRILFP